MGTASDLNAPNADEWAEVAPSSRGWRLRNPAIAVVVGVVAAALGLLVVIGRAGRSPDRVPRHRIAPAFDLPRVGSERDRVRLADFAGRPVVVNFWASWCVPCRKEMPALEAVAERLSGQVAFVGVTQQDGRTAGADFEHEVGVTYPSGSDPEGTTAPAYGVGGLPTTVLIDADGRIVGRHLGALTEKTLTELVRRAFDLPGEASNDRHGGTKPRAPGLG